uniref:hypothetical protein n=1 Tax=Paraburkholderia terrae TaxID=311230 RepID=UPI00296B37E1
MSSDSVRHSSQYRNVAVRSPFKERILIGIENLSLVGDASITLLISQEFCGQMIYAGAIAIENIAHETRWPEPGSQHTRRDAYP